MEDDSGGEAVSTVAASEAAAAQEPGGPRGPVDTSWLILQRLDDLRRAQDELRAEVKEQIADLRADVKQRLADLRADVKELDAKMDANIDGVRKDLSTEIASLRNWSLGLLLLAIVGLLAKLLIPAV